MSGTGWVVDIPDWLYLLRKRVADRQRNKRRFRDIPSWRFKGRRSPEMTYKFEDIEKRKDLSFRTYVEEKLEEMRKDFEIRVNPFMVGDAARVYLQGVRDTMTYIKEGRK